MSLFVPGFGDLGWRKKREMMTNWHFMLVSLKKKKKKLLFYGELLQSFILQHGGYMAT